MADPVELVCNKGSESLFLKIDTGAETVTQWGNDPSTAATYGATVTDARVDWNGENDPGRFSESYSLDRDSGALSETQTLNGRDYHDTWMCKRGTKVL